MGDLKIVTKVKTKQQKVNSHKRIMENVGKPLKRLFKWILGVTDLVKWNCLHHFVLVVQLDDRRRR